MKYINTVFFVIVAAAVLLAAYAIGLLIRQARVGRAPSQPQAASAPNEASSLRQGISDAETRAEIKQQRAETLEKMSHLTEEQKQEFRQRTRERFSATRGRAAEERARRMRRWQDMTEEQRQAYRARIQARLRARGAGQLPADGATVPQTAATEPNVEKAASEPNEGDPNQGSNDKSMHN